MNTTTSLELFGIGELSQRFGLARHRMTYALESRSIHPVALPGGRRVWSASQLDEINNAIRDINDRHVTLGQETATNAPQPI